MYLMDGASRKGPRNQNDEAGCPSDETLLLESFTSSSSMSDLSDLLNLTEETKETE
jgi:hypothetical protein